MPVVIPVQPSNAVLPIVSIIEPEGNINSSIPIPLNASMLIVFNVDDKFRVVTVVQPVN